METFPASEDYIKMKNSTNYGQIVKKARKDKNLSQQQLGDMIGVGKTTICNYETNYCEMSVRVLENIAVSLEMSVIEMISKYGENSEFEFERKLIQSAKDVAIPFISGTDANKELENLDKFMQSYITMPSSMIGSGKVICAKVTDDALKKDGICKNDYVFVLMGEKPKDKSIVMFVNKKTGQHHIRRYIRDGHIVSMMPSVLTTDFSPIRYDERDSDYIIVGSCIKVLSNLNYL